MRRVRGKLGELLLQCFIHLIFLILLVLLVKLALLEFYVA
eukprot:COSAG04_NODE_1485_length_6559_cov_7.307585_4_plen_40_part_00